MGLCIFDIDDLSFCLKFPVLQYERHVAVLGIVADVGDADTVTVVPSGSAGAGGGGDVGGKPGGHGGTVQVLVVVVAGRQCEGERRKCKNLVFIISVIILVKFHFNNCCTSAKSKQALLLRSVC